MNKLEFVLTLQEQLKCLPPEDLRRSLEYYNEMIDDRMEDGLTEEEAVEAIGSVDEIVRQIIDNTSMAKIVGEKLRPKKKLTAWHIALIIAGAPIWVSILLSVAAVVFSVYVSIWSVLISLYAAWLALALTAVASVPGALLFFVIGSPLSALLLLGGGLICGGISIFLFVGCKYFTKGIIWLSKQFWLWLKALIAGKEAVQ